MSAEHLPPNFRRLFAARVVLLVTALTANLLLLSGLIDLEGSLIVFAGSTTLYAVLTAIWWRCPVCKEYPGNAIMPDLCEQCGAELFGHDRAVEPRSPIENDDPRRTITHLLVLRTLYGAGLVSIFAFWGPAMQHAPAIFWSVTLSTMALGVWGEWKWWRCPHCNGYLKRSLWPGRTCGKCGGRLV